MISEEEKKILKKAEEIKRRQELEAIEAGDAGNVSRYHVPTGRYGRAERPETRPIEDTEEAGFSEAVPEEEEDQTSGRKEKKRHHILGKILLILLLLFIGASVFVFIQAGKATYKPFEVIEEDPAWGLKKARENGVLNILLIGTDARVSDNDCRADSIILMSLCPKERKVLLTSILRDSYVTIPGVGMNRINHAYQMGNARLLTETIEMNFHVRIDHYMRVDFYSFIEIIDAAGGVEIDVAGEEVHWLNAYLSEINHLIGVDPYDSMISEGGHLKLNGKQALAYSRIRYIGTDFGRTSRQRTVLSAFADQIKKNPLGILFASGKIYKALTTDMDRVELTLLSLRAPFLLTYRMETDHIPYDGTWWNDTMGAGGEVLGLDLGANTAILLKSIYGE